MANDSLYHIEQLRINPWPTRAPACTPAHDPLSTAIKKKLKLKKKSIKRGSNHRP